MLVFHSHYDYDEWEYHMPPTLPDYRFIRFRFYTPICVASVRLIETSIAGKWTLNTTRHYPDRGATVAQKFVNCADDPEAIRSFTERYGPVALPQSVGGFRFGINQWLKGQDEFQKFWRVLAT